MARLRDLPFDPAEQRTLREKKLDTSEDLWRAIGPQYEKGMDRLHRNTGIARAHLAHALGAAAEIEPGRRITPGKVLLAVLVLALVALTGLRVAEAFDLFPFPVSGLTAELDQTVVVPRNGLPAFHVLTESDLRLEPRPRTAGGITRKADAAGRYLLHPKQSGTVLQAEDLGPVLRAPAALAGRWIVTLQVEPSALGSQVAPGAETLLVLSAAEGAPAAVTATALVLAIDKGAGDGPAAVTVAVPRDQQEKVAAALGTSKVFLGVSPNTVHLGGNVGAGRAPAREGEGSFQDESPGSSSLLSRDFRPHGRGQAPPLHKFRLNEQHWVKPRPYIGVLIDA